MKRRIKKIKKLSPFFYHVLIFIIAQLTWFSLLGLWIYWYVTNYLLLDQVGDQLASRFINNTTNVITLVGGLVLLVMLSLSLSLIFVYLNRQIHLTRLYDNFIANVTHELKSPLSSIQLYLETMRKRNLPEEKQGEFVSLMLKDVNRLNHLINSILYLSSLERTKTVLKVGHNYQIYDADTVISDIITESSNAFNLTEEQVEIEGRADCECVVDRDRISMVFNNLFDNAVKYANGQPLIRIRLARGRKNFMVVFSDNGIGIPLHEQQKIFNKFQRIYNPQSPNVKGTGLGLYWAREIIEYHGGKISVNSAGRNRGTSFKIMLPIYMASQKRYINRLLRLTRKQSTQAENSDD